MRILKRDLKNNRVVLRPESPTDLYVLSTIITPGDHLIAKTSRRIRRIGSEGRSGDESQRVTMVIGIEVEDFSFQESSVSNRLRVKGKIFQGPEQHVSIGSYHTLNLEITQVVTIVKTEWSEYYIQLLKKAEEASKKPKICLIAIDKTEVCIGLLDDFNITVIAQEKSGISRKGTKEKFRSKQTQSFFDKITAIIDRSILPETKNIVIGGPGFIKEQVASFIREKFAKDNLNIVVAGSLSGGNRVGLSELLQEEAIDKLGDDFRVLEEQHLIEEFFKRINQGTTDVSYGLHSIQEIAKTGAIETIILIDSLLRGTDELLFSEVQQLLRDVEKTRGKISIVPSQSENAQKLRTFGGIVALLRYALTWE
ncbi:MAG: mRNA surveillance protein pelota [Candidatus Hodarchaeota archaeon]